MRKPEFVKRNCDSCGREVIADLTSRNHKICEDCASCPGYEPAETAEPTCDKPEPKYIIERLKKGGEGSWERVPDTVGHDEEEVLGHALVIAVNSGKIKPDKYDYRIVSNSHYLSPISQAKPDTSDIDAAKALEERIVRFITECGMPEDVGEFQAFLREFACSEAAHVLEEKTPGIRAEAVNDLMAKVGLARQERANTMVIDLDDIERFAKEMTEETHGS